MIDEDYKKVQTHILAASFADVLSNINKRISEVAMLEDMIIYNTGKTKQEVIIIYRTYIRKGKTHFNSSDEKYMKFLSDYIDCNFDIDALVAINEL